MPTSIKTISAIAVTLAFAIASSPAAASAADCSFQEDYAAGGSWTFVCDAGWQDVHTYAIDVADSQPCIETTVVDPFTIDVKIPTVCLDADGLTVQPATVGTLYVNG